MKLTMTNLESKEIVMVVEAENITALTAKAVSKHTEQFGEDYLYELLKGLAEVFDIDGDATYERHEFSDPEANFRLEFDSCEITN